MDYSNMFEWSLLRSSFTYHGPQLLEEMQDEQQLSLQSVPVTQDSQPRSSRDEFNQHLLKFIARKADLIFAKETGACILPRWPADGLNAESHFAALPPLEHFMGVPKTQRRQHFYDGIERDNVIIGAIAAVQETGLLLNVLTVEIGRVRDLDQLKITAFCPLREIPKSHSHENVLEGFNVRDKVRALVVNIQDDDRLIVSLQPRNYAPPFDLQLGLVSDEDLPLHYRRLTESLSSGGSTYESYLSRVLEFHNPSNVSNLTSMFGIEDNKQHPSLMRGLYRVKYNEDDYADRLRKSQSRRLAMRSVGEGVKYFKQGDRLEAMQLFNRALQIDAENIEALVARGALYANTESYRRAIEDFEEAIRLNPTHVNAKKYLHQTLTAFAYSLLDRDVESAAEYATKAVELDPKNEETVALLKQIQSKLKPDRKVSPSGSDSGHDLDDNDAVIKHAKETLLRMIEEDQSERGIHHRTRNLSSEDGEKWMKRESRLRGYSTDQFPNTLHQEKKLLSEEKSHLRRRSMNLSNLSERSFMYTLEPEPAFGPALPPKVKRTKKQKKKSRRSSSSSSSNSRSRSSSTSSSASSSSTSSSSSSSSSDSSSRSSSRSRRTSKKSESRVKSEKSKRRKKSPYKEPFQKVITGSSSGKRIVGSTTNNNLSRWKSVGGNQERQKRRNSYDRDGRQTSPVSEKAAKRSRLEIENSDNRKSNRKNSVGGSGSTDRTKSNSSRNENSEKKLLNYSSSSSSDGDGNRAGAKRETKPVQEHVEKETKAQKEETLQDLEQFMQALKAKKKAVDK